MSHLHLSLDELRRRAPLFRRASIAVGNFDGVHIGHAHILRQALRHARRAGETPVALTFDPHPQAVVGRGAPPALATRADKHRYMRRIGIEAVMSLRFDAHVAALSAERFVQDVLVDGLGVARVVVGDNFRFGRGARGSTRLLRRMGEQYGFALHVAPAVRDSDDNVVSSSLVRRLLSAGDVAQAARLLDRRYSVVGRVVPGESRGRTIGFPTANVAVEENLLLPADGVYRAQLAASGTDDTGANEAVDRAMQPAVAVIGVRPTFGGLSRVLEVYVLDFHGDLYGQRVRVSFFDRIRDVVRFHSVGELVAQMKADVREARRRFASEEKPFMLRSR